MPSAVTKNCPLKFQTLAVLTGLLTLLCCSILEKALSAASIVSRTLASLKKCRVPLRLFQGHCQLRISLECCILKRKNCRNAWFHTLRAQFCLSLWSNLTENFSNHLKFDAKNNIFYAFIPIKSKRSPEIVKKSSFMPFAHDCARCARSIQKTATPIRRHQYPDCSCQFLSKSIHFCYHF